MPVYGIFSDATISAGETKTDAIDLGRDYDYLSLIIPAMNECSLSLEVSDREGGTYYSLGSDQHTDVETFNRGAIWLIGGWRFIKIVASQAQSSDVAIKARGMRN